LNNGALNFFIPAVTLPQRAGAAPLELGFTYDSNQQNLQQGVGASAVVYGDTISSNGQQVQDTLNYYVVAAQTTISGGPLDINIPQLSASLEYYGDFVSMDSFGDLSVGSRYCLTNFAFKDWKGTIHSFIFALFNCSDGQTPYQPRQLQDVSSDNLFYHLDLSNNADFVVYAPDGTAYHFASSSLPCGPGQGNFCGAGSGEQELNMYMTSSVDRKRPVLAVCTESR
jgi:hypothetical protein